MTTATTVRRSPWLRTLLAVLALALLAAACNGEDTAEVEMDTEEGATDPEGADLDADADADADDTGDDAAAGDGGEVSIGWIPWDENIANTFLWKEILEQEGYTVTETQLDVAPVFQGVADGSLDLFLDAWYPLTHEEYRDQYGDDLEDLGIWYSGAALTMAVPDYVDEVQSIGDLADHADMFGGQIVGIEPGAGLTRITREEVMPGYGIDGDFELVESSTPAMLAELDNATSAEEPIVVTLWTPHWAYAEYPIRNLEDPEGLLGDAEELHAVARTGFTDEFPDVAEWIGNFEMDDDQIASLSAMINDMGDGQEQEAAAQWIEENREAVDGWLGR